MIAFTADYESGEPRPGDAEIADVKWFPADALPKLPLPASIARHLIEMTAARLRRSDTGFPLARQ
jgi:NAD+ diphosphatase